MLERITAMDRNQRIEIANKAIADHQKLYYKDGNYVGADFWDFAEIFEIIIDAYENTGDEKHLVTIGEMFERTLRDYGRSWAYNPYNDDIMWLCIALARAYKYTGNREYLDIARENFDMVKARSYDDVLGGGFYWRYENQSKNACVNCPGAIAACLIGEALGDEEYFTVAADTIEWTSKVLAEENGKVYDCINLEGRVNKWSSTYNQGTYVGANMLLYNHTGKQIYLDRASAATSYVMNDMYAKGIMNNEEPGNDLPGFKGIMARWLYKLANQTGNTECLDWLRANAESAWSNRNSDGIMWTQLGVKTEDGKDYDVFAVSAAISVLVNSI